MPRILKSDDRREVRKWHHCRRAGAYWRTQAANGWRFDLGAAVQFPKILESWANNRGQQQLDVWITHAACEPASKIRQREFRLIQQVFQA